MAENKDATSPDQKSGGGSGDPIGLIKDWWQDRVSTSAGNGESQSGATRASDGGIRTLHKRFVETALRPMLDAVGVEAKQAIITVRSSFCYNKKFVRPVYSEPITLTKFLQNPDNQKPFILDAETAFGGFEPPHGMCFPSPAEIKAGISFAASYKLQGPTSDAGEGANSSFAERISTFVASIRGLAGKSELKKNSLTSEEGAAVSERVGTATHCVFACRNKSDTKARKIAGIEVAHIVAIYYRDEQDRPVRLDQLKAIRDAAEQLFHGLDLIARIDATLFEREGLQLVAKLLPEFARELVAPADKIAFTLEKLRALFKSHMIGRHGGGELNDTRATNEPDEDLGVYYIATTFDKADRGYTPRLDLYPDVYRTDKQLSKIAYFLTHRRKPTATKLLLWRYFAGGDVKIIATTDPRRQRRQKKTTGKVSASDSDRGDVVTLDTKFIDLFPKISSKQLEQINPEPDCLLLTSHDHEELWLKLQQSAKKGAHSLAAFIVEGNHIDDDPDMKARYLPRGIFAIESRFEDGFSDDDISSLRVIFKGIASLIRTISHQHAPIDFRRAIAETFNQDLPWGLRENDELERFLFYTQKLDGDVFHELVKRAEEEPESFNIDETILPSLKEIAAQIDPDAGDAPTSAQREKILSVRLRKIQRLLARRLKRQQYADLENAELLEFLQACPENFTWASYLTCMAQTMGDRIKSVEGPAFRRMTPGFSASGMFMASVQGELRQVVKLSTADKVDKEARNYRAWVRYHLVNAARIPVNGFAFETKGTRGRQSGRALDTERIDADFEDVAGEADGVLVSDLVSGKPGHNAENEVQTLLDAVVGGLEKRSATEHAKSLPRGKDLHDQLDAVFREHAVLWGLQSFKTKVTVQEAFRAKKPSDISEIEKSLARLRAISSLPAIFGRTKLYDFLFNFWNGRHIDGKQLNSTRRIVHGDLNAHNLTWSDELKSFFLIDFEHTGPGLLGGDQMKLIANIIAETWPKYCEDHTSDEAATSPEFIAQMNQGFDSVIEFFTGLIARGGVPQGLQAIVEASSHSRGKLSSVLLAIVKTIDHKNELHGERWRSHWAMMLLWAALKEFAYACREDRFGSVKPDLVEKALDGKKVDDPDLFTKLTEKVSKALEDEPDVISVRYELLRHIMSARLLAKLLIAMKLK
jgi:hypothetical protein